MIEGFLRFSPLLEAIFNHAKNSRDKVAVYSVSGEPITYGKLWVGIRQAADFLTQKGVKKDDRVMISAQKEVEFIYFYFGAHLIGAVNVVVDASNSASHLEYIASVVKPVLAIGLALPSLDSVGYKEISLGDFNPHFFPVSLAGLSPESPAEVMFTSGTTGNPKGVVLSHFNIFSSASNINGFIGNTADDVEFLGLPICHSFGLGRLRCNFLLGATVVLHNGFANLKSVFEAFEKYKVTGFGMVPAVFSYIKKFSGNRIGRFAGQIKYIEIGSAAMSLNDKILLCQLFPDTRICMHYGLTEASRAVFMEFHENKKNLSVTGKAVNDKVSIRIFDEDGNDVTGVRRGEIGIKGNMVTSSYYLPEDNEGCFIDGYFLTGDFGEIDNKGNVRLEGRTKEMINVGGKKVSPVEVEDYLTRLGVGECMCVAAPDPDGILGEVPKVLLVKGTFDIDITRLREQLAEMLPAYKLPRFYEVVDSIPKTESGKKKRLGLKN